MLSPFLYLMPIFNNLISTAIEGMLLLWLSIPLFLKSLAVFCQFPTPPAKQNDRLSIKLHK